MSGVSTTGRRNRRADSEKIKTFKMSTQMDSKNQAILDKFLKENNDETIRRRLVEKYNAYYRHW